MIRLLPALLVAALLTGCGGGASDAPAGAADTTAAAGRPAGRPAAPAVDTTRQYDTTRLVTLGGPVTELAYAFGLGDNVVGTDQSSTFPEAILAKPRLGYWRATSAEGILSLRPTLVLAMAGLGPPPVQGQLEAAGVPVVVLPDAQTLGDAETRIRLAARVLGRPDSGAALAQRIRAGLSRLEASRPASAPRVLFVYARGQGMVSVFGTGTAAETTLGLAGAQNAVTSFPGLRPLTAEAVAEAAPDAIVIPAKSLQSLGGIDGLLRQPGLAQTPAGRARRVVAVDDALVLGLGPRLAEGVAALQAGLRADA